MLIWEVIKIGIRSLISHKLRSLLSILGVVFGVAAVIVMLSIGGSAAGSIRADPAYGHK
jgi:putative ABC transport system permease protein